MDRGDAPEIIRLATPADLGSVQRVETAAGQRFAEVGMSEIARHPPTQLAELRAGLAAGLLWVADDRDAGVVAFALARRLSDSLHLAELSVRPTHGRRGLGTALVRRVAVAARELGCRRLTLSTFIDVPWNAPFYERLGFRSIAAADLGAELMTIRRSEAAAGLPIDERVVMSLALADR